MKTSILICIRSLCLFSLLICLPAFVHAQERLQIADLFSKYGEQKDVTLSLIHISEPTRP